MSFEDTSGKRGPSSSDCVRRVGEDIPVVVNGTGDTSEPTVGASCSRNSTDPAPSNSPPQNQDHNRTECSPSDGTNDTNLDERIRLALSELDFQESNLRTSNFSAPPPHPDNGSVESSSDSEDEASPDAMGYMPLPQEPDVNGDCDGSEEGLNHVPIQHGRSCDDESSQNCSGGSSSSSRTRAPPEGDIKCTPELRDVVDENSNGASRKLTATHLKDGMRWMLFR